MWWGQVANGGKFIDGVGVVDGQHLVEWLRAQNGSPIRDFERVVQALRRGRHIRGDERTLSMPS